MFTNAQLRKTLNIILDYVYDQKLIKTTLSKKLIQDTYHKTAFAFNNIMCEHKDGVRMEALLEPVLANIIMTDY